MKVQTEIPLHIKLDKKDFGQSLDMRFVKYEV